MNRIMICCIVAVCVTGCATSTSRASDVQDLRPFVRQMLESPHVYDERWDRDSTPFFKALWTLLESHGKSLEEYARYGADSGRAVALRSGEKVYVVAILGRQSRVMPGTSAQQIVLISQDGEFLDKLACHINNRYGYIDTEIRTPPDPDGSQTVIVFKPKVLNSSGWHAWHKITYAGKTYDFREDEKEQPSVWDEKGLCRVKIADGRFVVLFPELKDK